MISTSFLIKNIIMFCNKSAWVMRYGVADPNPFLGWRIFCAYFAHILALLPAHIPPVACRTLKYFILQNTNQSCLTKVPLFTPDLFFFHRRQTKKL